MRHVTGIGGLFFRSKDPEGLGKWYEDNFGINSMMAEHADVWRQDAGPTVFAPFGKDTEYFGNPNQQFMMNFRVVDMDGFLEKLKASGTKIDENRMEDSIGKFAWVYDPEGNKIELWEPSEMAK